MIINELFLITTAKYHYWYRVDGLAIAYGHSLYLVSPIDCFVMFTECPQSGLFVVLTDSINNSIFFFKQLVNFPLWCTISKAQLHITIKWSDCMKVCIKTMNLVTKKQIISVLYVRINLYNLFILTISEQQGIFF